MTIREATDDDVPQILEVLRSSLGEISSKKTEKVWRYKHIDNPFGPSLVLVAEEGSRIVGVRAFMRWKWQRGETVYSAFRAVDTATHPDHQGKGVFKKLTLKALEIGKGRGENFVFNTPNSQSKPGYLKMGWKEVDRLRTSVRPVNPFFWKSSNRTSRSPLEWNDSIDFEFLKVFNKNFAEKGELFTPKNPEYLKWRYAINPLQDYCILANSKVFMAGYEKKQGKFRELRISEIIRSPQISNSALKKVVKKWAREYGVHFISFSPDSDLRFYAAISGRFGPVLTFRNMSLSEKEENEFLKINSWAYSLGDLELF